MKKEMLVLIVASLFIACGSDKEKDDDNNSSDFEQAVLAAQNNCPTHLYGNIAVCGEIVKNGVLQQITFQNYCVADEVGASIVQNYACDQNNNGYQNYNQYGNGYQNYNQFGNGYQNYNQYGNGYQNYNQVGNGFQWGYRY